jgi:hypothetical protein
MADRSQFQKSARTDMVLRPPYQGRTVIDDELWLTEIDREGNGKA